MTEPAFSSSVVNVIRICRGIFILLVAAYADPSEVKLVRRIFLHLAREARKANRSFSTTESFQKVASANSACYFSGCVSAA
jgi:hypothetical protein